MKLITGSLIAACKLVRTNALLLALLTAPIASQAQVTLFGSLANFDVYNDTGQETHGFEIELDGITQQQAYYAFSATRYGGATMVPFAGGVYVRWTSSYNATTQQFTTATQVPATFTPTVGHSCVMTNIAGCDHYGVVTLAKPTNVIYRWLVADPANPGTLVQFGTNVAIPHPTITVVPPPVNQPAAAPAVVFEIRVPPPPPPEVPKPELQFGEAKWVKVYKSELQREVALDELVGDNPIVPQDPGVVETAWKLLQYNPHSDNSGVLRNQGGLNSGSRAVIRRYEYYKFSGAYDPASHKAICGGDGLCNAPLDGELGNYIGSQMAAANVGVPSITVTKNGNGTVNSSDGKLIRCGSSCSATVAAGTNVTLTASPSSGTVFGGWGGACNGTQLTCTVNVNEVLNVTATFTPVFTLQVKTNGTGSVTGPQIDCGRTCSATFTGGTIVTLSATPGAGKSFINWTGACSGTAPTCDVTISSNTTVQANFK
jgi:hypothetical protein